jgi:hypothetical protein
MGDIQTKNINRTIAVLRIKAGTGFEAKIGPGGTVFHPESNLKIAKMGGL